MTETKIRATIGAVSLAVGVLTGLAAAWLLFGEEEERPPILVRGGSLIFQSGDPGDDDPDYQRGKPWKPVGADWQPDHDEARKLKRFSVEIVGGNLPLCPGYSRTKEITITYKPAQGPDKTFKITSKGKDGDANKPQTPTIVGQGLVIDNGPANPTLTFEDASNTITRVQFQAVGTGNVNCPGPASLKIWQE